MKQIVKDIDIILKCDCSEIGHLVRFSYFAPNPDNIECNEEFMYVHTGMDADTPFFHRLKNAVKYLFKRGECNWVFGETVLLPSDVRDLTSFLQKYSEYITKYNIFR